MKFLYDIWRYAQEAYFEPRQLYFVPPSEYIGFESTRTDMDYVFASHEKSRTVISFRGTDTAGGNWKAWISNLQAIDRIKDTIDPGLHDGFGEAALKFYPWVLQEAEKAFFRAAPVYLTGHSRGSAIAGITAVKLFRSGHEKFSVIGYGTPNFCNRDMRNQINQMPVDYTNVNTTYDIVATLPPHELGFRRPGKEYELRTNFFYPIPSFLKLIRGVRDHIPETYEKCLKKI
jgi:predicted lipase